MKNIHEKKVQWIELFFDLVYVVTIATFTHSLIHKFEHADYVSHFINFFVLFFIIWWSWVGNTLYTDRFGNERKSIIILTLAQMFLVLIMSLFIENALTENYRIFSAIVFGIRITTLLMYFTTHIQEKDKRPVTKVYLSGFSLGGIVWMIAIFTPVNVAYFLWGIGIIIDIFTPILIRDTVEKIAPAHTEHLPERHGLLSIIILGESIVGIVSKQNGFAFLNDLSLALRMIAGFVMISLVWWMYFWILDKYFSGKELGSGQAFVLGHFLIFSGIVLFAESIHLYVGGHGKISIFMLALALIFLPLIALVSRP